MLVISSPILSTHHPKGCFCNEGDNTFLIIPNFRMIKLIVIAKRPKLQCSIFEKSIYMLFLCKLHNRHLRGHTNPKAPLRYWLNELRRFYWFVERGIVNKRATESLQLVL
ncbi:hypothetical protein Y5W_02830 [Alcanivorax sp. 521-1]|uniref:Uncharacterized protein n=1 Tax=Alloalcanivorax profundimaris TaxID=2735259 RepID=A0ABS0ATT9_9GAMM|nr:hypothetical protein [Alloalcanivorax profundimaris]